MQPYIYIYIYTRIHNLLLATYTRSCLIFITKLVTAKLTQQVLVPYICRMELNHCSACRTGYTHDDVIKWPVTRSFDASFDLRLNKRLSKQSRGWWFETQSCSLWRHLCSVFQLRLGYGEKNHNVKFRSREIRSRLDRIVLKIDRYLGTTAADVPVIFQSDCESLRPNLAALMQGHAMLTLLQIDLAWKTPTHHITVCK